MFFIHREKLHFDLLFIGGMGEVDTGKKLYTPFAAEQEAAAEIAQGCFCGNLGDPRRECTCTPVQIQRYRSRLSGPLLDRIDPHVEVPPVKGEDIQRAEPGESSGKIRKRVNAARRIQNMRFTDSPMIHCNAQMGAKLIKEHCPLDQDSSRLLHQAIDRLGLSARAYTRILKIARTIADLEGAEKISSTHIAEAIQYRCMQYGTG